MTDDDDLEREGNVDEMAGRAENVADIAKDAIDAPRTSWPATTDG